LNNREIRVLLPGMMQAQQPGHSIMNWLFDKFKKSLQTNKFWVACSTLAAATEDNMFSSSSLFDHRS
jgi:hypothetical protein